MAVSGVVLVSESTNLEGEEDVLSLFSAKRDALPLSFPRAVGEPKYGSGGGREIFQGFADGACAR
jgi:hypothetical protein